MLRGVLGLVVALTLASTVGAGFAAAAPRDRSGPALAVGGSLFAADGQVISGDRYSIEPLAIDRRDRARAPVSGVARIDVSVGELGRPLKRLVRRRTGRSGAACTRGCPRRATLGSPYRVDLRRLGDGVHRIAVTAADAAGNRTTERATVIVRHVTPLPPQTLELTQESRWRIDGGLAGDRAGASVANAGDVDGDGLDDLLVGAPGADPLGRPGAGAAYLVRGSTSAERVALRAGEPRVAQLAGAAPGAGAGTAVAAGGDVNGDGFSDLLVGAPGGRGAVHVVFGGPGLADADLGALSARGATIDGPADGPPGVFGAQLATREVGAVATAGDVDGDGRDDVVIGSGAAAGVPDGGAPRPRAGTAYVVFGSAVTAAAATGARIDAGALGSQGFRIVGARAGDRAGAATALPGDIDGDERADVALTAPGAGRGGAAAVVYGRSGGATVDLARLGWGSGFRVHGTPHDALARVAPIGDVDGDSAPDLLLGGRGAAVLFAQPRGDVDLGRRFAGYRIRPPRGARGPASVAGAGDVDGDGAPDALVGYPELARGYLALGQIEQRTIDLRRLPGQRGTRLDGPAGSAAGIAADGLDRSADGDAAVAIGAPDAGAGAVYGATRSLIAAGGERACLDDARRFPLAPNVLPGCRRAAFGAADAPPYYRSMGKFNAEPACGRLSATCRPGAYRGGNARLRIDRIASGRIPLRDSFGTVYAEVEQVARPGSTDRDCYAVYRPGEPTPFGRSCDPPGSPAGFVQVQGKACMASPAAEDRHYMVRLLAVDDAHDIRFRELMGFVDRDAVPLADAERALAEAAYLGCGKPPLRAPRPLPDPLSIADNFGPDEGYQSMARYNDCGRDESNDRACFTPYQNYQVPNLDPADPAGSPFAALTVSSTAVSGTTEASTPEGRLYGGGGIVRAIVPRGSASRFVRADALPYSDPNVPCGQRRVARWVYGAANPGADRWHRMWAWALKRIDDGPASERRCAGG